MNGDGDRAGTGTGTGVETNEGVQDGNEDGSGDGAGMGTGTEVEIRGRTQYGNGDGSGEKNESSIGDGNEDEDGNGDGNEDRIGQGGREAKKRKKSHERCRRHVGNGIDLGGKLEKRRKERVGPVATNPDNQKSNKEAGAEAQGTQGLSKN